MFRRSHVRIKYLNHFRKTKKHSYHLS